MSTLLPDMRQRFEQRLALHPELDPRAVRAVASQEGLSGGVGDQGTSFGPFQLHQGGALPAGMPLSQANQWAWSNQGLDYALSRISGVAGGLKGSGAIQAIINQFERPADPKSEIEGALAAYEGPIQKTAKNLQRLKDTYGSWDAALNSVARDDPMPANRLSAQFFHESAPSTSTVSILESLGGIASKAAKAGQDPIPLPSKLLGTLKGSDDKVIDVRFDHNEPLSPNTVPIVQAAEKYLGTPYLWGGADPRKGFDCSGFVQYLYRQEGIDLPRTTYEQVKVGQGIENPKDLQPGDLVFFSSKGDVHHEGLYIGQGQFIHAPRTGDVVRISSLSEPYYQRQFLTGRRVLPDQGGAL